MKQVYKVLWFEDNRDVVEEDYAPALKQYLEDKGFELELHHRQEFAAGEAIPYQDYDLIVTDLNLGGPNPNDAGALVLEAVRRDDVLTDIVFYSSNVGHLQVVLRRVGFINRVTMYAGREGLIDQVCKVVALTIRRQQHITSIRGQFIAEAIDLEHKLVDFLNSFHDAATFPGLAAAKKKHWDGFVKDRVKGLSSLAKKIGEHVFGSVDLHEVKFLQTFDSFNMVKDGLDAVIAHYKELAGKGDAAAAAQAELVTQMRQKLSEFKEEVLEVRNICAHVKEEVRNGAAVLKSKKISGEEIIITPEWCVTTRRNLREHHRNLENMLALVVQKAG